MASLLRRTIHQGGSTARPSTSVVEAGEDEALLDVLRGSLGIRAAMRGCKDGSCGSCRVLMNGALVSSCLVKWREVEDGATIESYEDLAEEPAAARAVDAFSVERPTRCRLCVGALGVTAVAIARGLDTEAALEKATCMCTGRGSWRRALGGD
jgi:aerobic-type carbon monoxide dehydrogenase small subunit (CoxS/CutS family)